MLDWALRTILGSSNERELKKLRPKVDEINKLEPTMAALSDAELQAKTPYFKEKLARGATLDDIMVEAFAVCREASKRVLRMRHYDVQLIGGMVLHKGLVAEMRTGEGKTLVATLACYLNALEGKGVHVVTVNDYLARRDAEQMGKLYSFLGLTTGVVVNAQQDDEKKAAYQADITYGQNNEFGFDYLRDNMKFSSLEYVQRPLHYAIIDEADSILIDEARTPLIISGQAQASSEIFRTVNEMVPRLLKDEHYVVDEKGHSVTLTEEGVDRAQELLGVDNLYNPQHIETLHILNQSLKAHTLYKRDVNYLVSADGKVMIIDEFTGRVLAGRRWSDGLHQAVEAKENVEIQEQSRTVATITFQNLFRLYNKLSGMTGTAETEAAEFHGTYKLDVNTIPTNKPIRRVDVEDVVYKTEREKFVAVVEEILTYRDRGQPVLVGTTSVEKSTAVSRLLERQGIPHAVLNAKQHEKEAYVVAQAGRKGAITVSTNMAGRGTDILLGGNPEMLAKLDFKEQGKDEDELPEEFAALVAQYEVSCKKEGDEVRAAGGLHIVGTERHESRRIDNQLRGRAGRQGDPGSSRFFLSLEDDLMRMFGGDRVKGLMDRMGMPDGEPIEHPWVTKSIIDAQSKVEARNFDMRKNVLEYDDVMNQQRKTVYKIRQQLLDGVYKPELLDEDGKPTGKNREIKPLERLSEALAKPVREMLTHYAAQQGGMGPNTESLTGARIDDVDPMRNDIYQIWGYRIDLPDDAGKDLNALHTRIVRELTQSMTEQRERLLDLIDGCVGAIVQDTCPANKSSEDWNWPDLAKGFQEHFGAAPTGHTGIHDRGDLVHHLYKQAEVIFLSREKEMGTELSLRVFRHFYMTEIDKQWIDHLTNMEHLRDGIGLRGYGQRDPKQEYKKEGYEIFVTMMASVASTTATNVFHVRVQRQDEIEAMEREDQARAQAQRMALRHGSEIPEGTDIASAVLPTDACPCGSGMMFVECHGALSDLGAISEVNHTPVSAARSTDVVTFGSDEPCICGSGLAFKECHGRTDEESAQA